MPIAFPLPPRGNAFSSLQQLQSKPFFRTASNLGRPGVPFNAQSLAPGIGLTKARANVRRLGTSYAAVAGTATVNPAEALPAAKGTYNRVQARLNMSLAGVSRDNAGAVLPFCQVLVFRTWDKLLVAETTSDAAGLWSVPLMLGGPFFLVEYKDGGTPVAGTSLNTLAPVPV